MAPSKRKASKADLDSATAQTPVAKKGRRSNGKAVAETAASNRPRRSSTGDRDGDVSTAITLTPRKRGRPPKAVSAHMESAKAQKPVLEQSAKAGKAGKAANGAVKPAKATRNAGGAQTPKKVPTETGTPKVETANGASLGKRRGSDFSVEVGRKKVVRKELELDEESEEDEGPSYWLMKAEPDSRMEGGRDMKFSIDDLKDAKEPEGWDGVRNPTARNNMRAMRKGDLAFFYHSNCKVPGIAGIMEIVREHSVDETAVDPAHPYYDPKSTPEKPRWDLVHVQFRQKFNNLFRLKDLQKFAKPGGVLETMQTLKQTRLSVSKVTKQEWEFIMSVADVEIDPEAVTRVPVEQDTDNKVEAGATGTTSAADNDTALEASLDAHPETISTNGFVPNDVQEQNDATAEKVVDEQESAIEDHITDNLPGVV